MRNRGTAPMWESIKRGLQDGAAVAIAKAEGLAQVGRARLDIAAAKTRLSRLEGMLGATVFHRIDAGEKTAVADDGEVRKLCSRIREAREALREAEAEYEHVRRALEVGPGVDNPEAPLGT